MTYVATVAVEKLGVIRMDLTPGLLSMVSHRVTYPNGDETTNAYPVGPDTQGIGLHFVAVLDLIKDLHFAGIDGGIQVVQAGCFGQEDLEQILSAATPAYAIRNLSTSAAVN